MQRLVFLARFNDQATPPEGDPPRFTVHGDSTEITLLEGNASTLPDSADFDTDVEATGETTFLESGTMRFGGDADRIRFSTAGEGTLLPSAEEGLLEGSVIWRVEGGEGRFAGATGLITSNFTFKPDTGAVQENQVISLYLP